MRQIALLQPGGDPRDGPLCGAEPAAQQRADRPAARRVPTHYQGVPLVVTYDPAYLLRNPQDKARAWDDLCLAAERRPTAGAAVPAGRERRCAALSAAS